jgi:methylated-DNA-[protein]-cysteine S-methyltransferase
MIVAAATLCFDAPIGTITLTANDAFLLGLRIARSGPAERAGPPRGALGHPILLLALDQLQDWFGGTRTNFTLPLLPLERAEGAALRAAIAAIPYGETRTYGALGTETGAIARAVGQACKTNAYPIIIPCHRVVSSAGPEYYSGGKGPRTKSWLIDFEYENLPAEKRTRLL